MSKRRGSILRIFVAAAILWGQPAFAGDTGTPADALPCDQVRVSVGIQSVDALSDVWTETIEHKFEILVEVWNGCEEEVSIPPGQVVAYRATFPPTVGDSAQPAECIDGHVPVSGTVGPRRMLRVAHVVEGCLSGAGESGARPAVQIDGGALRTSVGLARFAPAEAPVGLD